MATRKRSIVTKDREGNLLQPKPRKKRPVSTKTRVARAAKTRKKTAQKKASKARAKERKQQKKGIDSITLMSELPDEAIQHVDGTLAKAFRGFTHEDILTYMELCVESDPRVERMLELYNGMPLRERSLRSVFDRLCVQVELAPDKFFGYMQAAALRFNRGVSLMKLAGAEPEVVEAIRARAVGERVSKDGGTADAQSFLKASGLIREGKSTTVAVQINNNQGGEQKRGLPEFEENVVGAVQRMRERRERLLTEGTQSAITVEAEEVESDVVLQTP